MLDKSSSRCLVSQEINEAINEGIIYTPHESLEKRIQPSSFEPVIGDEVYVIDTESGGLFRPSSTEPFYRSLLQIPSRRRKKYSIVNGFEIKTGFSYLFKLEERFNLPENFIVKASPKSSQGRIFNLSRLMADYHDSFDEVAPVSGKELELWLLLQPLAFNLIIWPGIAFNQLRFLVGNDCKLKDKEIESEYEKNPMLYLPKGGNLENLEKIVNPRVHDGLRLSLDISGAATSSIVGLRARKNPLPIDIKEKNKYNVEEYFEPVAANKNERVLSVRPHECYLLFSREQIKIPGHLNAELKDRSHVGINGPLHFAGFFDNGFEGCAVFEVKSEEVSPIVLRDEMPLSELQFFRCNTPNKIYGKSIGSNYNGQQGPRAAKHFKEVDFKILGKAYEKLNREVLVLPKRELLKFRDHGEGFEIITPRRKVGIEDLVNNLSLFSSRYDCEEDEEILQIIPYVMILRKNEKIDEIFYYVRAEDIKEYGDKRLFGKHSIGVGGHIKHSDAPHYLLNCVRREVNEEEVEFEKTPSDPILLGTLVATEEPVDRVHFGMVYAIQTNGMVKSKESSIVESGFVPIDNIINDYTRYNYETWSKKLIPNLLSIRDFLQQT